MIRLYRCVELYLDRPGAADGPTMPFDAPSHTRFHADIEELAIGSVMATFARYNTPSDASTSLVTRESLAPGCCAGLEWWQDWVDFPENGQSPWLGHDSSPLLEISDGMIAICAEQGEPLAMLRLSLARDEFSRELAAVETRLLEFTRRAHAWASQLIPDHASELIAHWET